jgi:hypothetical protein
MKKCFWSGRICILKQGFRRDGASGDVDDRRVVAEPAKNEQGHEQSPYRSSMSPQHAVANQPALAQFSHNGRSNRPCAPANGRFPGLHDSKPSDGGEAAIDEGTAPLFTHALAYQEETSKVEKSYTSKELYELCGQNPFTMYSAIHDQIAEWL